MKIDYIPCNRANYYTSGRSLDSIKYIVIHYTANNGDTARGNAKYFARESVEASANYFVDPNEVICSVKDEYAAWHCGGSLESSHHPLRGICTNKNSIGVELCSIIQNGKYEFKPETVKLAVKLVKELMAKYNIDINHVVRHYDVTGKNCPAPFVENETQWNKFKQMLTSKEEEETMTYEQWLAYQKRYEQEKANQQVSDYAKTAMEKAVKHGISDGSNPKSHCTREQVVVMLDRAGIL
jgi:N-acetylmuramoyl-L-alanine amidase CwlA